MASDCPEYPAFARCLGGAVGAVQHWLPGPRCSIRRDAVGGHPSLANARRPGLVSEAQMAAVMRRSRCTTFSNVFVMRPVATVYRVIRRRLEFVRQFKIRREPS